MIELGSLDLKGAVVLLGEVPIEAERIADRAVAGDELRAIFRKEVAGHQLLAEAEAIEEVVVVGKKRLADLEAREAVALQQQDGQAAPSEKRGSRRAGRTAADDDDVVHWTRAETPWAPC